MNNEDKFKATLRSLVESKEFPFEEKEWEKAAALLDKKRNWKNILLPGALLFSGLIIFVTALYIQQPASPEDGTTPLAASATPSNNDYINAATPNRPKHALQSVAEPNSAEPAQSANVRINNQATITKSGAASSKAPYKRDDDAVSALLQQFAPEAQILLSRKNTVSANDNKIAGIEKKAAVNEGLHSPSAGIQNDHQEKTGALKENEQTSQVATDAITNVADTITEKQANETTSTAGQTQQTAAAAKSASVNSGLLVPDSLLAKKTTYSQLNLEAGTDYVMGWQGANEARGFNLAAGIHYQSQAAQKVLLSFGFQYRRTGHLSSYTHSSKTARYSFGEESEVTEITPVKLHYLGLPLRISYEINGRQQLGAGYGLYYLFDVESEVTTYSTKMGARQNQKIYSTRGYTDGFTMFDSQLSLFYRHQFAARFVLHAEFYLGLSDVKNNGFFAAPHNERNQGARLMLSYKFKQY